MGFGFTGCRLNEFDYLGVDHMTISPNKFRLNGNFTVLFNHSTVTPHRSDQPFEVIA